VTRDRPRRGLRSPIRRMGSPCCARAVSGHATAAPPRPRMTCRRFIR
jgi:hypothetical protein